MRNFETALPVGYQQSAHICGMNSGFGEDLKTVLPGLALVVTGCIFVELTLSQIGLSILLVLLGVYPYFILHELVHALVYIAATGQPVKIGFTNHGAYCSVPDIYVCRKVAVTCTAAPLVVFVIVLTVCTVCAMVIKHWLFLPAGLLLTFHLLGCRSDVNLLKEIGKYRDCDILIRDNGSEQWIYQLIA